MTEPEDVRPPQISAWAPFRDAAERERCLEIAREGLAALQIDLAPQEGLFVVPRLAGDAA